MGEPGKRVEGEATIVETINAEGAGTVVLSCEHAANFIPPEFADLGLAREVLESHIAWDPGASAVARHLSRHLDAPLVAQRVSRLVYDCNRPPDAEAATPARSEAYAVPGNA
ncbi:N-formylglutamate amidohydrolase, partial [Nitratireductor sp. GCM10026969]|uniref:N-formylglutamate amidohydrolase n=1 Tax=Nitratireductor sp. GCM10026969 TaxID=3252645 RepID=UPI0036178478